MYLRLLALAAIVLLIPAFAFSQALDTPYQVKVFPNLAAGDSVINITNSGASATGSTGTPGGDLCVNVYVYSPDEQLVACCTCALTPNAVATVSARQLISKTLTPGVPTAITVKLIATAGPTCNARIPGTQVFGMVAFGTNIHAAPVGGANVPGTFAVTETAFVPSTLSATELTRSTDLCNFIGINGSGFGVCPGCTPGAAGAVKE